MAKYQCPDCGYTYDEILGHPHEGFPPGTPWSQVPEDFACPDCAVRDKEDFVLIGEAAAPTPTPAPEPVAVAPPAAAPQPPQPAPVAQAEVAARYERLVQSHLRGPAICDLSPDAGFLLNFVNSEDGRGWLADTLATPRLPVAAPCF